MSINILTAQTQIITTRSTISIITPVDLPDVIKKDLTIFDQLSEKDVMEGKLPQHKYYFYSTQMPNGNYIHRLPRYYDINKLKTHFPTHSEGGYPTWDYRKINFVNKFDTRNDLQENCMEYLAENPTGNTLVALQTGKGKTFVALKRAEAIGSVFGVFVHRTSFLQKWKDEILNMTDLKDEEVALISGTPSVKKAIKNVHKIKAVVCVHRTLSNLITKGGTEGIALVHEFFKKLGIGLKVYDEAHLEQFSIFAIDAHTHVQNTIYLSATPNRADRDQERIYGYMIPKREFCIGLEQENMDLSHVDITTKLVNSRPGLRHKGMVTTARGCSVTQFNKYMQTDRWDFFMEQIIEEIDPYVNANADHFDEEGTICSSGRLRQVAVAVGTLAHVKTVKAYLAKKYPHCIIGEFTSNVKKATEKYKQLAESDIIVTTEKSFGVGENSNVEILVTVVPVAWGPLYIQFKGRLRNFKDHHLTRFIDIVDVGHSSIEKMLYDKFANLYQRPYNCRTLDIINCTNRSDLDDLRSYLPKDDDRKPIKEHTKTPTTKFKK